MVARVRAKFKFDRRIGENIWGNPASPVEKRGKGVGMHAKASVNKRLNDYGRQLLAKQTMRMYYGNISEKQFKNIYKKASRMKGDTSQLLPGILESRLDVLVYRMKFAATIFAAKQMVSHGHVLVNGIRINIPSYQAKPGDIIMLHPKVKDKAFVLANLKRPDLKVPDYVELDHKNMAGKYLAVPTLDQIPYGTIMSPNLIVEFYAR